MLWQFDIYLKSILLKSIETFILGYDVDYIFVIHSNYFQISGKKKVENISAEITPKKEQKISLPFLPSYNEELFKHDLNWLQLTIHGKLNSLNILMKS